MSAGDRRGVAVARLLHGALTLLFLACIVLLWWAAISGDAGVVTAIAVGLLAAEGALVALADGRCPLEGVWRRLGDETPFFELLLGPRIAPYAIPALGIVTVAGAAVLAVRLVA